MAISLPRPMASCGRFCFPLSMALQLLKYFADCAMSSSRVVWPWSLSKVKVRYPEFSMLPTPPWTLPPFSPGISSVMTLHTHKAQTRHRDRVGNLHSSLLDLHRNYVIHRSMRTLTMPVTQSHKNIAKHHGAFLFKVPGPHMLVYKSK